MEKHIKIKATMNDGRERKFRTTKFSVKPLRDGTGLYIEMNANHDVICKSIVVEQKEIEPALVS